MLKSLWKYLRPMWEGRDNKISIKRVLALAFTIDLISNASYSIHKWEAGRSIADAAMLLGIEAGLIASLLGMTSYFNMKERQSETQTPQVPTPE
jgi:hypothetical protein